MKKHILVIAQFFYPEQFRINDIAREWVKRGYKVTVVTGIPNYPQGKFYPGYSWFKKRRETWHGIEIVRIPLIARGKSSIGMVANYLSFVVSGFFWKIFTKIKADCVFTFETSPMTQGLLGVWYAKKHKVPHYIYVQDLWPESVESVTGIHSKAVIGPLDKMVRYIYQYSDRIFATSPSFVEMIRKRMDEGHERVSYWPQYAEEFYQPVGRETVEEIPDDGRFKVVFTGNIGQAQGLDILPKVAKILKDCGKTDIGFVIVGDGRRREQLLSDVEENGVESMFVMVDRQPAKRIPQLLAACDVAFVSFVEDPLFTATIPAKLQSYMACRMPIVAVAAGETERVVREAACGMTCSFGDVEGLADILVALQSNADLKQMGENAEQYCKKHFSKKILMDQMDPVLEGKEFASV